MIPIAKPDLKGNEKKYLTECIDSTWISSAGKFIEQFENKFAEFSGTKYAASCCNGTMALHLALLAINIQPGDEVIVPNLTFAATANAVLYCNAKPVLVDIDKETWNIDPEKIEQAITPKTKAIIPVHLYGNPCDMDKIMEIANNHSLFVIEDSAEAHGAKYKNKKVGSIGHIGCFSFYGNKIVSTGEGGICTSNNKELIDRINVLKNHGMTKERRYWHNEVGYNYRMTNMQAAVGLAQLETINTFIERRRKVENLYRELLKDVEGIKIQKTHDNAEQIPWMFSIVLDNFKLSRDELIDKLEQAGIETRKTFFPLNEMPPYYTDSQFPNSDLISKNGISLPTYAELTEEEIILICDTIKNA